MEDSPNLVYSNNVYNFDPVFAEVSVLSLELLDQLHKT